MAERFASGKNALGLCDDCGFTYKLNELKPLVRKGKNTGLRVCPTCWDEDHPQLRVGEIRVSDAQAVRHPRPDTAELEASRELTGSYEEWLSKRD